MRWYFSLLWLVILCGVLLRFTDLLIPDMATDEAQFALGSSAAQPPLGMWMQQVAQSIFGANIIAVRGLSAIAGVLTLITIYAMSLHMFDRQRALVIVAVAALFPGHILFSRLAYLSALLCFFWALTTWTYLRADRTKEDRWIVILFLVALATTFIKTQGLLLPGALLLGRIIQLRTKALHDPLCYVLTLSLVPIGLYIITDPGIPATILNYGGSLYGVGRFVERVMTLSAVWWSLGFLMIPVMLFSIKMYRRLPWAAWVLIAVGSGVGFILGPGHQYYTAHLVFWAIPIGLLLYRQPLAIRTTIIAILFLNALYLSAPRSMHSPGLHTLFQSEGYWNAHAAELNDLMRGEERIFVLGPAGHHLRWYLEPRLLVANNMDVPSLHGLFLLTKKSYYDKFSNPEILYEDDQMMVIRR